MAESFAKLASNFLENGQNLLNWALSITQNKQHFLIKQGSLGYFLSSCLVRSGTFFKLDSLS